MTTTHLSAFFSSFKTISPPTSPRRRGPITKSPSWIPAFAGTSDTLYTRNKNTLALLLSCTLLSACSTIPDTQERRVIASNIAQPAGFSMETITTRPFTLTAQKHIRNPQSKEAMIYIEGDGLAWLSKRTPSLDPTPTDPTALRLAARDPSDNIIYLARPCQYTPRKQAGPCKIDYWSTKRFAPEVLQSYHQALDTFRQRYAFEEFHLVGFSGGGNIAALLAAERADIASLRTVAGNLDHRKHSEVHNVSILKSSLNAKDYAQKLAATPQHHFIGGQDNIVPPSIFESFLRASKSPCIPSTIIPSASHTEGWEAHWSELLQSPLSCGK